MTLADINLPVSLDWGRAHVLAFSAALCRRLVNVQAWYGDPRHVPDPAPIKDGRWALSADVLTECLPGGIVYAGFSRLDPAGFGEIEVIPVEDVADLWYGGAEDRPPALVPEEVPPAEPEPEPESP